MNFQPEDVGRGAIVPPVEPADLHAVLKLMTDFAHRDEQQGRQTAVGLTGYKAACSPDADIGAVWFRAAFLCAALKSGEFEHFKHERELGESFIRFWATFPFKAVNIQPDGSFQLNGTEIEEELRKLAGDFT